jgi:cytochrome c oxidase subunit 4
LDAAESAHLAGPHETGEHGHPGPAEYVGIAGILAVVTALEVGLYYLELAKGLLITLLFLFSAIKFTLVVMFFMHLKFDSRLFSWLFVGALVGAMTAFVVVLAAFRFFAP